MKIIDIYPPSFILTASLGFIKLYNKKAKKAINKYLIFVWRKRKGGRRKNQESLQISLDFSVFL